jgi:hypothetical protein
MIFKTTFALIPLAVLTQIALARASDEIRDPEVLSPSPPAASQPCVMDMAVANDRRIDPETLRVMQRPVAQETLRVIQANPTFERETLRRISRSVEYFKDSNVTDLSESKYRSIGCGFYFHETTVNSTSTAREKTTLKIIVLTGPGGQLFHEMKKTGRGPKAIETDWSQMKGLQITGGGTPLAVGNRYEMRYTLKWPNGYMTYSNLCQVTERRPASEFNSHIAGDAFITTCQSESLYFLQERRREAGTGTVVVFSNGFILPRFDPTRCRLDWKPASEIHPHLTGDAFLQQCVSATEVRLIDLQYSFSLGCPLERYGAAEFNRNLHGDAWATRCPGRQSRMVFFPELGAEFWVDTIDPTRSEPDPDRSRLLTEIEISH